MNRALAACVLLATLLAACTDQPSERAPTSGARHPSSPATTSTAATSSATPLVPTRAVARLTSWRLPDGVAREAAVRTGRRSVVLGGGLVAGDRTTSRVVRLDLSSGQAHMLPPLAVPVHDAAAGLVSGNPTVVGGGNTSEQAVIQSLQGSAWRQVGNLPTTRSDLDVVQWRRHAYVIGGYDGSSEPTSILRVSSDGAPHAAGTLINGVRYAATARLGAQVFVIGGEVAGRELDAIQRVDLATGRVHLAGHLPIALGHAMAATVGGRILVMGGRVTPTRQTNGMWWFDPATGRCDPAGHLPTPLSDAAAVSDGHQVWLLGGETPAITDAVVAVTLR